MKYLLLLVAVFLTGCDTSDPTISQSKKIETADYVIPDKDGCTVQTQSKLVTQHKVGPIQNLVKDKMDWGNRSECNVKFDITVNGETYHLEEFETGLENAESLCYYAKERARKNLLLELGGTFNAQAVVACRKQES